MNIRKFLTLDEVKKDIVVQNPGGRSIVVKPEETGYSEDQKFTSDVFPKMLIGKFIGVEEDQNGNVHPKYVLMDVTSKKLEICGKTGYINGPSIMNNVCNTLLSQKGIWVRSIRITDRLIYPYYSSCYYWIASRVVWGKTYKDDVRRYGLHVVNNRGTDNCCLFDSENKEERYGKYSLRCVVILKSIVVIENNDSFLPGIDE